jgi:hypothetical protein
MTPWPARPNALFAVPTTPVLGAVQIALTNAAVMQYADCQTISAGASHSAVLTTRTGDGVIYAPASHSAAIAAPMRCPAI